MSGLTISSTSQPKFGAQSSTTGVFLWQLPTARVRLPLAATAAGTTRRWPLARHFAPGGGGDNVTELCYGAVGAGGPTANTYLPGTGTYDPGGNAPAASGAETKDKDSQTIKQGGGTQTPHDRKGPKHFLTDPRKVGGDPGRLGTQTPLDRKTIDQGGGTFREHSGKPLAKGPRQGKGRAPNTYIPGPKHLHTGEHSGNGQEPLGNGGEQGTETARTNLWIDTQY